MDWITDRFSLMRFDDEAPTIEAILEKARAAVLTPKRRERNGLLAKRKNAKRSSLCIEMRRRANADIPH